MGALVRKNSWTDPQVIKLYSLERELWRFLMEGSHSNSQTGIYRIMSGAIQDAIGSHNLDLYAKNDWELFKSAYPHYDPNYLKNITSLVYPFMNILETQGLIKYDRGSHVVRVVRIHKFRGCPSGRPLVALQHINKTWKEVDQHKFYDDYFLENQDYLEGELIPNAESKYLEKIKGNKKISKTDLTNPSDLEVVKKMKEIFNRPKNMVEKCIGSKMSNKINHLSI